MNKIVSALLDTAGKVSPKVAAASATTLVVSFITNLVKGSDTSTVSMIVSPIMITVFTFAAGWVTKHEAGEATAQDVSDGA